MTPIYPPDDAALTALGVWSVAEPPGTLAFVNDDTVVALPERAAVICPVC